MLTIHYKVLTVLKFISITITLVHKQTIDYEEVYPPPTNIERIVY